MKESVYKSPSFYGPTPNFDQSPPQWNVTVELKSWMQRDVVDGFYDISTNGVFKTAIFIPKEGDSSA